MSSNTGRLSLEHQVALVTGAGTGIGLMMSKALANEGAKVYITGRRLQVLEDAASSAGIVGPGRIVPLRMDIVDEGDIKTAVETVETADGYLNILINNAGTNGPTDGQKHAEFTEQKYSTSDLFEPEAMGDWVSLFKLNTVAPFFIVKAFKHLLLKGAKLGGGTANIINISSVTADLKYTNTSLSFGYSPSKAALERLTLVLAAHFAKHGEPIRVNVISPGVFPSELSDALNMDLKQLTEEPLPGFLTAIPAKRLGTPEEIGRTAVYLATTGYVNGAIIKIDGGGSIVNP